MPRQERQEPQDTQRKDESAPSPHESPREITPEFLPSQNRLRVRRGQMDGYQEADNQRLRDKIIVTEKRVIDEVGESVEASPELAVLLLGKVGKFLDRHIPGFEGGRKKLGKTLASLHKAYLRKRVTGIVD